MQYLSYIDQQEFCWKFVSFDESGFLGETLDEGALEPNVETVVVPPSFVFWLTSEVTV